MTINDIQNKQLFCRCTDFERGDRRKNKPIYCRLDEEALVVQDPPNSYTLGRYKILPLCAFSGLNNIITFSQCKKCKYGIRQVLGKCELKHEFELYE